MIIKLLKKRALWRINFYPFFLVLSFLIWCFAFKDFLSGKVVLASDAIAYYEHFKFFTDQLIRGIYPMWDPTVFCGIPFEFFARRIGSFNPLFGILLILKAVGIPHLQAYLAFLALYFFVGMIGYFKLAYLVLNDRRLAFVAFLLLMFSSLGTRLFDSYILLTFIPMVWFFYFMVAFGMQFKKHQFLGMTLTAMILFTTYLPFYFITVLISFIIFYAVFYFRNFIRQMKGAGEFIAHNKILVIFCVLFFAAALLPGVELFKQAKKGEFVLAYRHSTLSTENSIEVDPEWRKWSGMEDIAYSFYSSNLKKFNFAVLYLPVFTYLIFMMGIVARLNKKLIFLFCWGGFIFLLSSPNVTETYNFLNKHISYFKYFRNLHFFLWIVVLPIFMLFLAEQMKSILQLKPRNRWDRIALISFVVALHGFGLWFFVHNGQALVSTYIVFGLSFIFFILYFSGRLLSKKAAVVAFIIVITVTQSIEVFHYLTINLSNETPSYRYQKQYLNPPLRSIRENPQYFYPEIKPNTLSLEHLSDKEKNAAPSYYDVKWSTYLFRNIQRDIFDNYRIHGFYIYDRIFWAGEKEVNINQLATSLLKYENLAYVNSHHPPKMMEGLNPKPEARYEIVSQESQNFHLINYDVNAVKIQTDFSHPRFLVYNDSYYDGWQAFINGKKADLYRTNMAFKGLWVPAGKSVIQFKFGYTWQYFLNYGLLILFYGLFLMIVILWIKDIHYVQSINRLMHKWIKIGS